MILGKILYDREWLLFSFLKKVVYFFKTLGFMFGKKEGGYLPSVPLLIKKNDSHLCNACGLCETVCPSHCLEVVAVGGKKSPSGGKMEQFYLDLHRCIGCRLCVQVCPEEALTMGTSFAGDAFSGQRLGKDELVLR